MLPGAESHAGQIFCCVATLSICNALDELDANRLGWWLAERQCDSGGLNGRPEKQADVLQLVDTPPHLRHWIVSIGSIVPSS